jgi:hypothetical protein
LKNVLVMAASEVDALADLAGVAAEAGPAPKTRVADEADDEPLSKRPRHRSTATEARQKQLDAAKLKHAKLETKEAELAIKLRIIGSGAREKTAHEKCVAEIEKVLAEICRLEQEVQELKVSEAAAAAAKLKAADGEVGREGRGLQAPLRRGRLRSRRDPHEVREQDREHEGHHRRRVGEVHSPRVHGVG